MKIEWVDINTVIPYEKNAKKHNKTQIRNVAESIKEFGWQQPIVVDGNNTIIIGHCRLESAKLLGLKQVPITVADFDEKKANKLRLLDNKTNESEWDIDLLISEIPELDFGNYEVDWGLPEEEPDVEDDNFDVDEALNGIEEPIAKIGQVYKLGEHRLMCGDSTNENDVKKLMNNKIASIEITSPPYNIGKNAVLSGNTKMTDQKYLHSDDDDIHYIELLMDSTKNGINNSKYAFVNLQMLANNKKDIIEYLSVNKDLLCDIIIWNKGFGAPAMAENVLNSSFEFIFIFSKDNSSRSIGTKYFRGTLSNVINIPPQRKNEFADIHSATFSIEFVSYFIENFTNKNERVLDLFGGTGTTLIACEQLNRKCYMMELDPKYVDVIIKRWEQYTGKQAELISE